MSRLAAAFGVAWALFVVGSALTASTAVPASRAGEAATTVLPSEFAPPACGGLALLALALLGAGTDASTLVVGTPADDAVRGRGGDDCLLGGAGDDTLRGGGGNDVCIGGPGNDAFHPSCDVAIQ